MLLTKALVRRCSTCCLFLCISLLPAVDINAQVSKEIHSREQAWVAYFNQARLTNRFGLWLDVHYRMTGDFVDRPFQFLFRPAVIGYIKDNLRLSTGYAFINHFPAEGFETSRPEHRAWEQIWWNQKYKDFNMVQWLRLEQRFLRNIANDELQEGYLKTNRIRYNVMFTIPLKGKELVKGTPLRSRCQ